MRKIVKDRKMLALVAVSALALVSLALLPVMLNVGKSQAQGGGASPVATKITYQGQLRDDCGVPLSGTYDMEFRLWTTQVGGSQVGSAIPIPDVTVTNGLFSVKLPVDADDFNGQALWLEISIEGEVLDPRQEILPVPYALHALSPPSECIKTDVFTVEGEYVIDVPSFCIDGMCEVFLWWNDGYFGAFGPELSWPAYYMQTSVDNSWIGGPNLSIAGTNLSGGAGINGDGSSNYVLEWGETAAGGHCYLKDDGAENSPDHWSVYFVPDADNGFTQAAYYFCPKGRIPGP